eukprot:10668990-Ditylum_brightwellii.AAC.1
MQSSTSIAYVSCPVPSCAFDAEMPKKVFIILPKADGSKDHLNFGEDYKVFYNAEWKDSPKSEMWKLKQAQ